MLGGGKFPGFSEENRVQYDKTAPTQLQLIGHDPTQFGGGGGGGFVIDKVGNEQEPTNIRPMKRAREEEPVYIQQKLGFSPKNNLYTVEHGCSGFLVNPNHVSSMLRLSSEKEEPSSSITTTSENLKNSLSFVPSLDNTVKLEMDRQMEEIAQFIKLQEEHILKSGRELNERHTISLMNVLEKGLNKKLQEKELEIENLNLRNKELDDKIKQVSMEAQSWHYRAKHSESVASVLKNNIQQLMAHGTAPCHEGFGDSEVDDALSCLKYPGVISWPGNQELEDHRLRCRSCKDKRVSALLFPCRHLCLCADCEGFIDVCPICQVRKTASFPVIL